MDRDLDGLKKVVGEEDVEHVTIPAPVRSVFVVVQAQMELSLLKAALDRPAEGGPMGEDLEGGVFRGVGEGEAKFAVERVFRRMSHSASGLSREEAGAR